MGGTLFEGDRPLVGGDGFGGLAEPFVDEAEVVLRSNVVGIELQAGEEVLPGIVCTVEVKLCPAKQIQDGHVIGRSFQGGQQPMFGVGEVVEEDVIGGDGDEVVGGGIPEAGSFGIEVQGVDCMLLPEKDIAEEEKGVGDVRVGRDEGAKSGFGGGEVSILYEETDVFEGILLGWRGD